LNEELVALRQRRSDRLTAWTPEHPEIQDLDARIAQAEAQLAAEPRVISQQQSGLPVIVRGSAGLSEHSAGNPTGAKPTAAPVISARQLAEAGATYRALSAEFNRAIQREQALARAERDTWQQQSLLPGVEVIPSQPMILVGVDSRLQSLAMALLAGILATAGVALIFNATQRRRTFATVEQVQNTLSIRVIGSMPRDEAHSAAVYAGPAQRIGA
jgi:uncharacterized protein involved in exopolysaccharide biosynthesis